MRKLMTLSLAAASALAIALPAAAQPGYPYGGYDPRYGRGYDQGYGYDNGYGYGYANGQRYIAEADRLRRQIDIDRQQGRMNSREYNKFRSNIDSFRNRAIRVSDRYRGGVDPYQTRDLDQELYRLQRWYYDFQREHPERYAYGYGNGYGGYPNDGRYGGYPYDGAGTIGGIINDILRGGR
jgi:hypothetical protein